ncbi:hypothetical protein CSV71_09575 [Sporosarcina sp. P21c]|uniref:hypothetical protein n=1 Tax=unclassified Sporosarcina TaxID=2647733 RepID=UPI000C172917|nr:MULTISPECIES: hypothetical protein [unclassified Sporosarcina]PIC66892.1 hypothetical protein CSV78_09880 [Sporosarcina sp. P16a]PIC89393.1 hypothetical protein CSV71_09575 [Sporosarcina sp. P21c]PIC92344.1 hypothetical protein CSV70_10625 [Sporosarcina sp. P25]
MMAVFFAYVSLSAEYVQDDVRNYCGIERLEKLYERLEMNIERVWMRYERLLEVKSGYGGRMIAYTN